MLYVSINKNTNKDFEQDTEIDDGGNMDDHNITNIHQNQNTSSSFIYWRLY
jgi:hypothetical protein